MTTEKLSLPIGGASASTNSAKQQMLQNFQTGKEYRFAFVEESIRARLTAQIKVMRDQREWDYKRFSDEIGKKVSWAYRLEDPNEAHPTIPTLLQVAQAFDVGLDVRFLPFSKLLDDVTTLRPESFSVASFDEEIKAGSFWTTRRGRKIQTRNRKSQHRKQIKTHHRGDYRKVTSIESYGQRSLLSASAGAIYGT